LNRIDTLDLPEKEARTRYGTLNLERRKYPRFSVDLPVEYDRVDSTAGITSRALNIGEGGLLIYFPEQVEVGQRLRLRLFFSVGSELNIIEVLAKVAWVDIQIDEGWGDVRTGVKFVDISLDDMNKLKSFVKGLSQPPYTR
jgi:c-di-GMP-binding flagellar brake protein YcgR